ncbi:hypothetical protein G3A_23770 [Bacillus sp. 17376]|uniref:Uncharacterized protein n=1 Tax=Mesobacillus boroniphilus JCM 21738 TaxID=1294265 RepID=W4RT53_9BACI|nr:hypothetical protein [Mesobacillus boroniphilus]ESU30099.1 hypothetical protein G3A_23770 [Bacillus sp. 17376]GAE47287.1 hypothetical protein JCM21738_4251 [Mesobacillus boroniphilus JCM 21738]
MKKILTVVTSLALAASSFSTVGFASSASAKGKPVIEEQKEEPKTVNYTVVTEYDENGIAISETTITEGDMEIASDSDVELLSSGLDLEEGSAIDDPQYAYVDPGSMNYYFIDSFTGSSTFLDKLSEWSARFAAATIPAMLTKSTWVAGASSATFETFYNPSATRYYKTNIYQAKDTYWYYGKHISYQYSDSARTNLTKKVEFLSKTAR